MVTDTEGSDAFSNQTLVMNVRECDYTQIHIPFQVGDDRSSTWVITRTGSGLSLKHDHRHKDSSEDAVTLYGGLNAEPGFAQVQSFPADSYTRWMFAEKSLPQSLNNIWKIFVYPDSFSYQLVREGREFRVDFDLTQPVDAPPAPWAPGNRHVFLLLDITRLTPSPSILIIFAGGSLFITNVSKFYRLFVAHNLIKQRSKLRQSFL